MSPLLPLSVVSSTRVPFGPITPTMPAGGSENDRSSINKRSPNPFDRCSASSPTTLIALLKAVAYGWNQEKLARNAHEISMLGKELHDRLRHLAGHMESVGKGLDRAVESYNKAVGTLESRVIVSARKFAELGAPVSEQIPEVPQIETTTRTLALEWDEDGEPTQHLFPEKSTGTQG